VTLCSFSLLVGSCATDDKSCPAIGGVFEPLYTVVSSSCGPIPADDTYLVPFDGGPGGVKTTVTMMPNVVVTTDIVMKGCTVHMSQEAQYTSGARSKINGDVLNVKSANHVSGMVTFEQMSDLGQPVCSGTYQAEFTKGDSQLGGAASLPGG